MTETLQIDQFKVIELNDAPRLLVEWTPRWQDFVTSIGPAFSRSGPRLAGEAPHEIFPYKGMAASLLMQAFLLFAFILLPREVAKLRPYAAPKVRPYEVIYYSGDELPRTEDLGGSQSGNTGKAGGEQAYHRTQTIHIARGSGLASKVVDAPDLKLPAALGAVANLLALKSAPDPGLPPTEGLRSSLKAPNLPANIIAPTPDVAGQHSRRRVSLDAVVPPAPNVAANNSRNAPSLNAAIVPPAPSVNSEHRLTAPVLDASIIGPAPNVSRDHALVAPRLSADVVAPAPAASRDRSRSTPALNASIIPPSPSAVGREVAPSRVQMNNAAVIPPPVSAPERDSGRTAKLNMPAPSVIAPPPAADSTRDLRRLESGGTGASTPNVIPPPSAANTSIVSTIIGKFFGTQEAVPPPPSLSGTGSARGGTPGASPGGSAGTNVIPPPPSVGSAGNSRTGTLSANVVPPAPALEGATRSGAAGSLTPSVVAPPPSVAGSGNAGGVRTPRASLGAASVIPPPPSVTANGQGQGAGSARSSSNNPQLAANVIPPPPSVNTNGTAGGSGRKGTGLGGPGDVGSALAPPKSEGNGDKGGVVVSAQPGSKVGISSGEKGSLAMSPAGGEKPGLGGSGGGAGIGHGEGPGSGMTGTGSGAAKTGTGVGSETTARGGISPTPGPGGAGSAPTGAPAVPGVDVRGGSTSNIVNLPSFGESSEPPAAPGRTPVKQQQGPAITIVATSRSGGAFDFYGKLPGDNYTVYVDTPLGVAVMQFAEVNPAARATSESITGPQGLRTDLPAGLPHARMVVKCRLDASGNLKNLQVLEPGPATMTAKVLAALPSWKFVPAKRGAQPVEVNAILGFNIDTNDRY
ncbi:MAG TPA: energy transducer TonB [Candidatus Binatia bacterium]|nr:energy transducer TonB [Candidatus Binatia bacterium]